MDAGQYGRELSAAVAAVLRGERSAQKVTYDQLAEASGISRRTVIRLLQGDRPADLAQLSALSGALSMSASDVLRQAEARVRRMADATAEMERHAEEQSDAELPLVLPQQGVALAARRIPSRGKALRTELDAIGEESQDGSTE